MEKLKKLDPEAVVLLSEDEEGSGYRELYGVWGGYDFTYEEGEVLIFNEGNTDAETYEDLSPAIILD